MWEFSLWMLLGVAVFLGGDWLVERRFGSEGAGGSMGIVVGSVVDGSPSPSSSAFRSPRASP
jgi:ZIP family zinc transporter